TAPRQGCFLRRVGRARQDRMFCSIRAAAFRLRVPHVATAPILVLDDEPAIQDILTWSLEAEGYHVATAASGEEALTRFAEQDLDVIVTDLLMAGLNGLALLQGSRVLNPRASVIVMTAYAALETAITALRRG